MTISTLYVDGMLSGTGIRDSTNGGYVKPEDIGLSNDICIEISSWLIMYEDAHFHQFKDSENTRKLDEIGLEIAKKIRKSSPIYAVKYFSNAKLLEIDF